MATTPKTKTVTIEGVPVKMQQCNAPGCVNWFVKTRKNRSACSERCAMKKTPSWQKRNEKAGKATKN